MKGYIQVKYENTPIYNEFGEDVSNESVFHTGLIPCKYYNGTRNDIVEVGGGNFIQASYIITTKDMNVFGKHFALYDSRKKLICQKDCKSLQRLENIRRAKIIL